MLANRVKELEAGIAEDEADLEQAVHEMDREMKVCVSLVVQQGQQHPAALVRALTCC
jgi:hypothetical protein